MTGAGFGGGAVAGVESESAGDFSQRVAAAYEKSVGVRPAVYVCNASAGASVESLD
jgi:galactokinase